MTDSHRANRLIHETSPYLLQHAYNPVDWHPWSPAALELAVREDKPIFLSIGYSACHWCHVMERESFEDDATAAYMNDRFVNIKVDREERPDLDAIYMDAVNLMTRHGGWPMSVFLMPDGTPFHGGTYFPPTPRQGMPSFRQVLEAVADAYASRPDELRAHGQKMVSILRNWPGTQPSPDVDHTGLVDQALNQFRESFDQHNGGFSGAPKFPQPMTLDFVLTKSWCDQDLSSRNMAEHTLNRMLNGGIFDQIGGGFHRYSVDAHWLVPHFEKMLYDNAQLLRTYLHAWQLTGDADYRRVITSTIAYVLREMTHPEGGFYSAQDADSEGEEGKFFVWSPAEIEALLEPEAARAVTVVMNVTEGGNFEGRSILHRPRSMVENGRRLRLQPERLQAVLDDALATLWQAREERVHPARDDKILTEWNGLMMHALAECGAVLPDPAALQAARAAGDFIWARLRRTDGRLRRSFKDDQARFNGYLEDHAAYGLASLALFEADAEPKWLERGLAVADVLLEEFEDREGAGAFFQTGHRHETLVIRRKDFMDNAVPSGNSLAAEFLLRLHHLTVNPAYLKAAERIFGQAAELLRAQPTAFGRLLEALNGVDTAWQEVIIVGPPADPVTLEMAQVARQRFHPYGLVMVLPPDHELDLPLLAGKTALDGKPTAYVCRNHTCRAPVTTVQAMLDEMTESSPA